MLDPTLEADGIGPSAFSEALAADWAARRAEIADQLKGASVLVVGAAGTIGAATVRQLLPFAPAKLELVDIDENGLARLARDIRSRGDDSAIGFNALDFAGWPGLALAEAAGPFDLVLNFAAVKHVRSEKNLFTLLHMIDVNVVRQQRFAAHLASRGLARRHFVVSTDKAADPASFMGATKLLLEAAVFADAGGSAAPRVSAARFANVAYSSGSLPGAGGAARHPALLHLGPRRRAHLPAGATDLPDAAHRHPLLRALVRRRGPGRHRRRLPQATRSRGGVREFS